MDELDEQGLHELIPMENCEEDNNLPRFDLNEELLPQQQTSYTNRTMSVVSQIPPTYYDVPRPSPSTVMVESRPTRESVLQRLSEALLRRSLTKIDLSQKGLMPSDARLVRMALMQNAQLSSLKLGYNNLGNEGVSILSSGVAQHQNLQSLDLGFNNIGDEGCQALCAAVPKGSQLHTLYLAGNLIGEDGAIAIADLIRRGSSLRKLYLTGNRLGPDGVRAISDAILEDEQRQNELGPTIIETHGETKMQANVAVTNESLSVYPAESSSMEQLYLGGASIGVVGSDSISRLVRSTTRLRVLSLPNCEIGDESIYILATSIKANRHKLPLESLQLSFNKLTCLGMESLSNAIWGSRTLKELLLDNNQIADRGAQQIAAVLPHVKTMEILNIGFNQLKAPGIKLLMKAVVDSSSVTSISVSGNSVDTSAAKAIAYALAYNRTMRSLSVVHCNIGHEGQRHISAGIVSNSKTSLRDFSGFKIGPVIVTLGFPGALEHWNNVQILNFIHLMWKRNQSQVHSNVEAEEKMMDPLSFLCDAATTKTAPLEATIVVEVAKKAFAALVAEGYDVFSRRPENSEESASPIACEGIMVEALTISSNFQEQLTHRHQPQSSYESTHSHEAMPSNKTKSFVASPEAPKQRLPDPSRKKRIVEWLCSNIQHLNKLAQLPFSSAELFRLHQHYFTPVVNESGGQTAGSFADGSASGVSIFSVPEASLANPALDSNGTDSLLSDRNHESLKSSGTNSITSLSMLKRKGSYRFLGDAALCAFSTPLIDSRQAQSTYQHQNSVPLMIEGGPAIQTMPIQKRARRNRTRISFLPKVKAKLDSYLDVCHEKALITMRQLYYVEQAILSGKVNPIDSALIPRTHLSGDVAADAETIVVDMI